MKELKFGIFILFVISFSIFMGVTLTKGDYSFDQIFIDIPHRVKCEKPITTPYEIDGRIIEVTRVDKREYMKDGWIVMEPVVYYWDMDCCCEKLLQ